MMHNPVLAISLMAISTFQISNHNMDKKVNLGVNTNSQILGSRSTFHNGRNMKFINEHSYHLHEMTEEEILYFFINKNISPYQSIKQKVLDYSEKFLRDGRWIMVRKMRGPIQIEGQWFIKNNKLCVSYKNSETKCRTAWKSHSSKYFYFSDLENFPDKKIIRVSVD